MAKKFGKFLLFTAAVSAAGAVAYYFMQKKDYIFSNEESDEDYDDFSNDPDHPDASSRTYVPLNQGNTSDSDDAQTTAAKDDFTPLAEQVSQETDSVEEFFDEADSEEEKATDTEQ